MRSTEPLGLLGGREGGLELRFNSSSALLIGLLSFAVRLEERGAAARFDCRAGTADDDTGLDERGAGARFDWRAEVGGGARLEGRFGVALVEARLD